MSKIESKDILTHLYFKKLPEIYRTEDYKLGDTPLLRYIQSLVQGGLFPAYDEATKILDLLDPMTCPEEFLPCLYETFGLTYYRRISAKYHRIALKNISEIIKRRGTYNGVRYLVQLFSGYDCTMFYQRTSNERKLVVYIEVPNGEAAVNFENSASAVKEYLEYYFIPHYINLYIKARIINKPNTPLNITQSCGTYIRYTKVTTINN